MLTPTSLPCENRAKRRDFGQTILLGPKQETVVRVVYSDESGTGSEHDEPLTVVAGMMLNADSQWHPTLNSIETALRGCLGREDVSAYEIRGRNLYHQIKRGDEKAHTLLMALSGVPRAQRLPVFYGAVDRAGFKFFMKNILPAIRSGRNPDAPIGALDTFNAAMEKCIVLADSYVHTAFPDEQVLWIHDKGKYDNIAKWQLNAVRSLGASYAGPILREIQSEIGAERYLETSRIVDTVYFGDSKESRALQLADVCCSTITRHLRGDPIAIPYYEMLRPCIINDGSRPEHEGVEAVWARMKDRT